MAKVRRMFPGGNTSQGFYSLHDNIIGPERNMLYIIKGMPGGGKSSLMREIAERMIKQGYSVEYHHCPSDSKSIDAIVIEELKICLLDGTPPHGIDPIYPGLTDKIIDLGKFIDEDKLKLNKSDIIIAKENNKDAYGKAFSYFKAAKIIFEEIAEENKKMLDIKGINNETKEILEQIFEKDKIIVESNGFKERHLFTTAYTPEGFIDYTNTILEWITNIYYINGEIGTGKTTLLNRILEEGKMRNYHVEVYHNSLIPNKIESLYIKDIDTIVTWNKEGQKKAKVKIDFNKYFDNSKLDTGNYNMLELLIDRGVKSLNSAKENHFILEKAYRLTVDYSGIDKIREEIYDEILNYVK